MKNLYLEIMPNPAFAQQQKIWSEIAPTLTAIRNASEAMAKISPTYLRSLNHAAEIFKHVDTATLARSAEFVHEMMPAIVASQKFLDKINASKPEVAEKTFEALNTQTLDDEIILPPETPKETNDLITDLRRFVTSKNTQYLASIIQAVNSVAGNSLQDSATWSILLWLSVVIVILNFFLCSSDD